MLPTAIEYVHELARQALRPGGFAIDATAGNGHDTLFLAQRVGKGGAVSAFDVQEAALRATDERLVREGVRDRVDLHHVGHEQMESVVPQAHRGAVQVVMFNLGYLPGGDKSLTTQRASTVEALGASLEVLAPGGLIAVVCYTGHPGGQEEAEAVAAWACALDQRWFHAVRYAYLNQQNRPPHAVVVEKRQR